MCSTYIASLPVCETQNDYITFRVQTTDSLTYGYVRKVDTFCNNANISSGEYNMYPTLD